ncbi:hypothetical protein Gpo141_00004547 [Globisporangium polare]
MEIGRALEAGKVDAAVHALLLTLGDPLATGARKKREATLKLVLTKIEKLLELQSSAVMQLTPGVCANPHEGCLSYSQLQMFALHKLEPASTAYNIVRAVKVTNAPFDEMALGWTCSALMAKHDVLRTCFDADLYGEPRQHVLPVDHFIDQEGHNSVLHVLEDDCPALDAAGDSIGSWIAEKTTKPFDLSREVPIRVYAIAKVARIDGSSSSSSWVLIVVLHHIVTDPESREVFWNDFAQLYSAFCTERGGGHSRSLLHNSKPALLARLPEFEPTSKQLSYRDYAHWQHDRLQSGALATSLQYWIQHLSAGDGIPILELPVDKERKLDSSTEGNLADVVVFQSSPELQKAFTSFCKSRGCSVFVGLMAVFQLLLSRLSSCDDIVIGAPTSARGCHHEALEKLVGYFVNPLPFRLRSHHDMSFQSFVAYVRDVVLNGLEHMEIPLQKILEHVAVQRSDQHANQNPLYQVMFAFESSANTCSSSSTSNSEAPRVEFEDIALPPGSAKFDLMLTMRTKVDINGESILEGSMEFPVALFHRETIARFTGYFLQLLTEVMHDPLAPLRTINMIPEVEQHTLLHEWGTPAVVHQISSDGCDPDTEFLDECLLHQVQSTPENVALRFEGIEWTYQKLWKNASRFAAALKTLGIAPGDRVGLFLDRGLENVAAMISVLQLRAVFVPLDTEFPVDRIRYMISDSRVQVIVSQAHHKEKLSTLQPQVAPESSSNTVARVLYCEDLDCSEPPVQCVGLQPASTHCGSPLDTVAYILYTSGSTGNPKGVMVTHANILTTLRWTLREYQVSAADIFLQSTSSTLDGSLTQLFSPLLKGASAVLTKKNGLHDLFYMRDLLTRHRISLCVFVPSYFAMLVDFMGTFPSHVTHVVLAGEAFPTALAEKFYEKHATLCPITNRKVSPTCLVNEYGPTEASVTSTFYRFPCEAVLRDLSSPERETDSGSDLMTTLQSVPIGKPIDDHFVAVLDAQKRLVPVNVLGELYVGGRGVAKGYWERPELTAKSFEHPELALVEGLRWYKTGDRVKWLENGELLFLGRIDSQVKLRGMRVELHEIRNAILGHAWVKDAEVLVVKQQTLVGFVLLNDKCAELGGNTGRPNQQSVLSELRAFVSSRLPVHMVPHELRIVDNWPRTPNGKLDVRALADVASTILSGCALVPVAPPSVEPSSSSAVSYQDSIRVRVTAAILKQAWSEALGVHDHELLQSASFFELGGNSLTAIRVISLVKAHGVTLKLESFFRCKTLVEMARVASTSLLDSGRASPFVNPSSLSSQALVPLNWRQQQQLVASTNSQTSPPLFLVHCADGTVWKMLELAGKLAFPVVGVQATSSSLDIDSMEALAKLYWQEIRAMQPQGPYSLGGFSFGCRVAHEIARLAHAEGHRLNPLTLLDGIPCSLPDEKQSNNEDFHVNDYLAKACGYKLEKLSAGGQVSAQSEQDADILEQLATQYLANCKLNAKYQPYASSSEPIEDAEVGDNHKKQPWLHVHLYKTQEWEISDSRQEYRERLGIAIDLFDVPGTHLTLLQRPHVDVVASRITENHSIA